MVWAPDGKALYASANNIGNHSIFRINPSDGMVSAIITVHTNANPQPLADGRLLFARDSLVSPVELFVLPAGGGEPNQITHLNDQRLAEISFGRYKQFSFPGANSDEVFGYFIYPVDFDPKQTYPLAFLIHGGPQGSFDDHWHYRWNPQIYAGHGYATVMIDFHGSTGYGQDFTDAINGDWGGAPYDRSDEGARPRPPASPMDRLRTDGRGRRELRRLHDQLGPGPHRSLQGPGLPRRQPRRAHGLLRHRGAVVPRVGARRHPVGEPRRLPQALSRSTTFRTGRRRSW